jgi:hypothetical protein
LYVGEYGSAAEYILASTPRGIDEWLLALFVAAEAPAANCSPAAREVEAKTAVAPRMAHRRVGADRLNAILSFYRCPTCATTL